MSRVAGVLNETKDADADALVQNVASNIKAFVRSKFENETWKPNVSDEYDETDEQPEATLPDAEHEEPISLKRELFKDSQIYNLLGVEEGSGCSAALIQLFCERFDKERGIFKVNDGIEISFCAHRVADLLSIKHTGKTLEEFEKGKGKEKLTRLPLFVDNLKHLFVTKNEKKERKDRNDKDKHNNRIKRELSANSLIEILRRMSLETDEQKEQYKQLVRLFVIDQIFLPSTENAYIRSGNYKYCSDGSTFESINWAQAILDRIYVVTKNTQTFSACSTVFQALIYDKIPSLVPKDMKPKSTLVAADKYPVIRKKKESWKLELDKLNSKDVTAYTLWILKRSNINF
ncbi:hypothetical protein POM88_033122 [Heracleum sosnowskyi]|uniref:Uncharacterized protein n=1 Tax=Heracleum sosnowskyi TaxID=360622 RepID=A0AAD8I0N8_9APIA|nr:hypothetical protein POM88_033122 [Heracleum sosnowskyi]